MTVTWREAKTLVEYEDGSTEPAFLGMVTKQAGELIFQQSWKETQFRPGDQVRFDTKDFTDISLTLFLGALRMRDAFLEKVKALGIEIEAPQQAALASDTTE